MLCFVHLPLLLYFSFFHLKGDCTKKLGVMDAEYVIHRDLLSKENDIDRKLGTDLYIYVQGNHIRLWNLVCWFRVW